MEHRCPECGADLRSRRLAEAIIARMEIDCAKCGRRIRVNVHPLESAAIMTSFALIVGLAAAAYWLQSRPLMLVAFAVVMASALVLPVLERTCLRTWPRYVSGGAGSERP